MSEFNLPDDLTYCDVGHLPIVKAFANKIGLVETFDTMVDSQMELSPGVCVLAMVLDTLSGRTPLYRLEEFFDEKDSELLLGHKVRTDCFSDHNVGRVLDKIFDTGTQKIFSKIAQNSIAVFDVDARQVHFDTTSISVFGDYDVDSSPFDITYGHSKDKRPDLKQFLVSMLCVDRNIPIISTCHDGNASDKTLNNELLGNISKHMAKHRLAPGAFIYVADSAFVTPDNLKKSEQNNTKFLTRLPATYKQCDQAIEQAVIADNWIDIGTLNVTETTKKRPAAHYRGFETHVQLYDNTYRALVIHSSAHDKRRHKRIERLILKKRKELEAVCKKVNSGSFFCEKDAQQAADKLCKEAVGSYHKLRYSIKKVAKYPRGRPSKDQPRVPLSYDYILDITVEIDDAALVDMRLKAGCFVLLCNLIEKSDYNNWSAQALLQLYKNQSGIEQNFGFLKDPVIVNSIFLKTPKRIEVLGLILVISLLIWRLMERCMRQYIESTGNTITGWEKRPTKRPTSFMMTTKFLTIIVLRSGDTRRLGKPLKPVQLEFLKAMNLDQSIFITP